jgi:hypothetical protein
LALKFWGNTGVTATVSRQLSPLKSHKSFIMNNLQI